MLHLKSESKLLALFLIFFPFPLISSIAFSDEVNSADSTKDKGEIKLIIEAMLYQKINPTPPLLIINYLMIKLKIIFHESHEVIFNINPIYLVETKLIFTIFVTNHRHKVSPIAVF